MALQHCNSLTFLHLCPSQKWGLHGSLGCSKVDSKGKNQREWNIAKKYQSPPALQLSLQNTNPTRVITKSIPALPNVHDDTAPETACNNFPEVLNPLTFTFVGALPEYLHNATFYRLGLGCWEEEHKDGVKWNPKHLFDVLSMLTSIKLDAQDNTVTIMTKVSCAHILKAIRKSQSVRFRQQQLATTGRSVWEMIRERAIPSLDRETLLPFTNYGVTVERIPVWGLVARTDMALAQKIDGDTLEVKKQFRFSKLSPILKGLQAASHGMIDEKTGDYYNFVWKIIAADMTKYRVFKIRGRDGEVIVLGEFYCRPKIMHSFGMTEDFIIFATPSEYVNTGKLLLSMSVGDSILSEKDNMSQIFVFSRHGQGHVATFLHPGFNAMHVVNAFESDGNILLDLLVSFSVKEMMSLPISFVFGKNTTKSSNLVRVTLPDVHNVARSGKLGNACSEYLSYEMLDLPQIHPDKRGLEYRFMYSTAVEEKVLLGAIKKLDLKSGSVLTFKQANSLVDEPCFVAKPDAAKEDEGVLLIMAFNTQTEKSTLLVLDAQTFQIIATASMSFGVPIAFHWFHDKVPVTSSQHIS